MALIDYEARRRPGEREPASGGSDPTVMQTWVNQQPTAEQPPTSPYQPPRQDWPTDPTVMQAPTVYQQQQQPPAQQAPSGDAGRIEEILRQYQHSPLSPQSQQEWLNALSSGRTTYANFENEVRNTMSQPGAYRHTWGAPAGSAGAGGGQQPQFDEGWFTSNFGRPGTPNELIALEPRLQQYGIKVLRNAQGVAGKIQYPSGQIVDVINSAGLGGRGFQWLYSPGGSEQTGQFFNDPIGSWYTGMVGDIIKQLQGQPQSSPELDEVMRMLRGQIGGGPRNFRGFDELEGLLGRRVEELNKEPWSQGEEAARRVGAFDSLSRSHEAARQQVIQRMSAAGHGRGSGTIEAALQEVDNAFNGLRAQNENKLLLEGTEIRERRRNEAVGLRQQLAQLGLSRVGLEQGDDQRRLSATQELARIAQQIASRGDDRLMRILEAAGLIPFFENQRYRNAQGMLS